MARTHKARVTQEMARLSMTAPGMGKTKMAIMAMKLVIMSKLFFMIVPLGYEYRVFGRSLSELPIREAALNFRQAV
jgi:hypothetical protein